jgi:bisphosphoglycerate-independent phosphoglycerate mutase (AlkP superfamily)
MVRHEDELARGEAVASEIVNTGWRLHLGHDSLPEVTAAEAGIALARIAGAHRLTFFAHYATDTAGHRGGMEGAVAALERVDEFLGGYLGAAPADAVLLIASDHGNLEDVTAGHTRNPVMGLVAGPQAERRAGELRSIVDVADAVLRWLEED